MDGIPFLAIETDRPTGPELRPICEVSASFVEGGKQRFVIDDEVWANARLIAAAPDHALIGWAMCVQDGTWEEWYNQDDDFDGRGEFCFAGLRYATKLDAFGIPELTPALRAAIAKARGESA